MNIAIKTLNETAIIKPLDSCKEIRSFLSSLDKSEAMLLYKLACSSSVTRIPWGTES